MNDWPETQQAAGRSVRAKLIWSSFLRGAHVVWRWRAPIVAGSATLLVTLLALGGRELAVWNWAFGKPWSREMGLGILLATTFALIPFTVRRTGSKAPLALRLALLLAVGALSQVGFVAAESRGMAGLMAVLRDTNAHREFVEIAVHQPLDGLVANYESLAAERHWRFPRSKPPGALMVYRGFAVLSQTAFGRLTAELVFPKPPATNIFERKEWRINGTLLFIMPFLTYLTIIPLFFLSRRLAGERAATLAILLYAFAPSVATIPYYLDGAVYPLMATTALWLSVEGVSRIRLTGFVLLFLAGLVLSMGVFISFSLLPATALAFAVVPIWSAIERRAWLPRVATTVGRVAALVAGFALFHGLALAAGYRPLPRYADAMEFHRTWWSGGGRNWLLGSPILFAVWLGPAVACALVREVGSAARRVIRPDFLGSYTLFCAFLLAVTDYLSNARIESQRLWLFWIPLLAVPASARFARWEEVLGVPLSGWLVFMQLVVGFALKFRFCFF